MDGSSRFEPLGIGVGTLVNNRYELVRKLGSGAVSAVYQVADRALNNDIIALKLFSPGVTNDSTMIERFHNEVLVSRKLNHPNIVRTYDFGRTDDGHYYMTMEFIRGLMLERIIHGDGEGAPTFADAVLILYQLAKGIEYAHVNGIIHRDLKPANIMVSGDGQVKIADFGLARTMHFDRQLTQVGECVGTPFYMAPEQVQEKAIDGRVDIYALGIIAYELVTGAVPFAEETWYGLATQIIEQPIPEIPKKVKIPKWYREFVRRAAAKDPNERFQDDDEIVALLARNLESESLSFAIAPTVTNTGRMAKFDRRDLELRRDMLLMTHRSFAHRLAPYILVMSLIVLGLFSVISVSGKASTAITTNVAQNTERLTTVADSMSKMMHVVEHMIDNQDKIAKLSDKLAAEEAAATGSKPAPDVKPAGTEQKAAVVGTQAPAPTTNSSIVE